MPLRYCVIVKILVKYLFGHHLLSLALHVVNLSSFWSLSLNIIFAFGLSPSNPVICRTLLLTSQLRPSLFTFYFHCYVNLLYLMLHIIDVI